jgi:hypothetical protein
MAVVTDRALGCVYGVLVAPNREVDVDVVRDLGSAEHLRRYRARVLEIANELKTDGVNQAPMVVTFRRPVSPTEFRNFVRAYSLEVTAFEARGISEQGDKVTIGGAPSGDDVFPQHMFDAVAAWSNNSTKLVGVTSFEGAVSLDQYDDLSNDPLCFLADVLPAKILSDIKPLVAQRGLADRPVDVNLNDLFWAMEDLQP